MYTLAFTSDDLPSAVGFTHWSRIVSGTLTPVRLSSPHAEDFHGSVRMRNLGAVQLVVLRYSSLLAHRPTQLIRRTDPGLCQLMVPLHGSLTLSHAGQDMLLRPGDLVLKDSSQPFQLRALPDGATADGAPAGRELPGHLTAQFPRSLLSARDTDLDQLTAVRIPTDRGMGALLSNLLVRLGTGPECYRPAEATHLGTAVVDLFGAVLASSLHAESAQPREAMRRALVLRIHGFIHRHLPDPRLSPATIASAHHISLRHLHRLFQEDDTTVSAWIRHQRLEHCRHDLADPQLSAHRIHAIAAQWGYPQPADFSRAFRTAYGITPREFRHIALRAAFGAQLQRACAYC